MVCQIFLNDLHFIVPLIKPTSFVLFVFLLHQSKWYCYQGDGAETTVNQNLYGLTHVISPDLHLTEAKEIQTERSVSNLRRLILQLPASNICVNIFFTRK